MTDLRNQPSHRVLSVSPTQTFLNDFNRIMTILGTNQPFLWPFWEPTGTRVMAIASSLAGVSSETAAAAEALEDDFSPLLHFGGVHSYDFDPVGDHHIAVPDHADLSPGDGSLDTATSWGAWVMPRSLGAERTIMAKYDSAGNLEEWKFSITTGGLLQLELHDASASASEIGTGADVLPLGVWSWVVVSYVVIQSAPSVKFYVNGAHDGGSGATTETGSYTAMEGLATPLTIGCAGVTATPTLAMDGRIALPFMTGKELSASADTTTTPISISEIDELYRHFRKLMGA